MTECMVWDVEADFLVLGSGAAGLTGGLVAAAGGADVALIEKTALIGGTTAMSGGAQWIPANHHMAKEGVSDSPEEALAYLRACAAENADEEILAALVEHGAPMLAHVESLGVQPSRPWPATGGTWDYRPWLPGAKHGGRALQPDKFALADLSDWAERLRVGTPFQIDLIDYYRNRFHLSKPRRQSGEAIWRGAGSEEAAVEYVDRGTALAGQLLKACLAHGVRFYLETRAEELIAVDGRIAGVRASIRGRPWRCRARYGVLVATGGFAANTELTKRWVTRPLHATCEIPENEGDGHLMGMATGAQMAGIGDAWWMPFIHIGTEDENLGKGISGSREDRSVPGTIVVNRQGRRFINEAINYYDFTEGFGASSGAGERNFPAWLIFDHDAVERYAILASKVPPGPVPDWLTIGRTLAELATKLGIDPVGLEETCVRFSDFARSGKDPDFHRGESDWDRDWGDPECLPNPALAPVERAPFYAVEVIAGALATRGGLRVNENGEVLSALAPFRPIPGLYAAGNCSNASPMGCYPGPGSTIGAAMTFGYIVGRQIAAAIA